MNSLTLAMSAIKSRPLPSLLCIVTVMSGLCMLCATLLLSSAIRQGILNNARGIDMVVGAKGSPLQLVLSSVYQLDIPTGNISISALQDFQSNPRIRQAIPIAMGDNYKGFRLIGTTPDYLTLYKADLADGRIFTADFEAVAGADKPVEVKF